MGTFTNRSGGADETYTKKDDTYTNRTQTQTFCNPEVDGTCAGDLVDKNTKPISIRLSQRLIDLMERDKKDSRVSMRHIITIALNQYYRSR